MPAYVREGARDSDISYEIEGLVFLVKGLWRSFFSGKLGVEI
jgi:hypothetical protein